MMDLTVSLGSGGMEWMWAYEGRKLKAVAQMCMEYNVYSTD